MEKFTILRGRAAPLMRQNIDTEVVIRINRLLEFKRGELGSYCFESWRYLPDGSENKEFILNQNGYRNPEILICGENFGCGSSREAAVWSLWDFGVRCIIAPSFGDIFAANCLQNGVLAIRLPQSDVGAIGIELEGRAGKQMTVDLIAQKITTPAGRTLPFDIEPQQREALLEGLDEIGLTLRLREQILNHQKVSNMNQPWMYPKDTKARTTRILFLAGDGVGKEIMAQVHRIVSWFMEHRALALDIHEELFGLDAWTAHGSLMRPETWQEILKADAILFGATGASNYDNIPESERHPDCLLRIRQELDLFNNLRPVKTIDALSHMSTLRPEVIKDCDLLLVRELTGGIYFGEPKGIETLPDGQRRGFNTMTYKTGEIRRIARSAFEIARSRKGQLCSVDKANVLETSMLWRKVVQALHDEEYPEIALQHMYVDNAAMQLVRSPRQFDVIVTENLFGDILSDCAAMVAGSIGLLPSASIGPLKADGKRQALYEPIHGSAPDIAGKGVANPLGAILSLALCLRYSVQSEQEASLLEKAVDNAINAGARTADIAGTGNSFLSTEQMGDAVIRHLAALVEG
jgi:3-isopropylmalate dehydrogenase